MLVHIGLEMPLPSAFHGLAIALVLWNGRDHATIPQEFARFPRIKAPIRIEKGTFDVQSATIHVLECILELLYELVTVIVVASDHARRRNNLAMAVRYRQASAGLGLLPALIGDTFAPFFAIV